MPDIKQMVCLANSRKMSGRCIAGKQRDRSAGAANWIRLVSARENQEVSEWERQYQDGSDPRLLDIIAVPVLAHCPAGCQSENWLLDPDYYWEKKGTLDPGRLHGLVDRVESLWINGYGTSAGRNDRIPETLIGSVSTSLVMIHLRNLGISVFSPGLGFGNRRRRVQGKFEFVGVQYALWITDPIYEREYLLRPNGDYEIGECYLTVSLGESYRGSRYKLIAAIIAV